MKEHLRFKSMSLLCGGVMLSLYVSAQDQSNQVAVEPLYAQDVETIQKAPRNNWNNKGKSSAVVWTEDFASGIPTGWVNQGFDGFGGPSPNALWEYRGPNTIPSTAQGSRGNYAAPLNPILSPTQSNGFIIFDSDYLDNDSTAVMGNGVAPAPHVGTLTTNTIDLTGHPNIELGFSSFCRQFQSNFQVAISTDDGLTFPDTVSFHTDVSVNSASANGNYVSANISAFAGNQATVKLQIIFDGLPGGYYFWMIDDMLIQDLPANFMRFVESGGAPANDIIFGANGGSKTGIMDIDHVVPITFDSNILNYGFRDQTSVVLNVDVIDASGSVVASLTSPTKALILSGDVADFNDFTTSTSWTPSQTGAYDIVYYATSDSIAATDPGSGLDTVYTVFVTDSIHSLDYNNFDNSFGTDNTTLGPDGCALASSLYFNNVGNNGDPIGFYGIDLRLSTLTVPGGDIEVHIYDTAGFDFVNGFGSSAIYVENYTILSGMPGTNVRFNFTQPPTLNAGTYFVVVYMFSNNGANRIRIANDQSVSQPGLSSIMYSVPNGRWYSGFSNSRTFSSPWIRAITGLPIGIDENNPKLGYSIYPNPTEGRTVKVAIEQGGTYNIELVSLAGERVMSEEVTVSGNEAYEMNIPSSIAKGTYFVNIKGEDKVEVSKLTIN